MKYPINCNNCNQALYGPVKYCPFCGIQTPVVHVDEEVFNKIDAVHITEESVGISKSPANVSLEPILKLGPGIEQQPAPKPDQFSPIIDKFAAKKPKDKQQILLDVISSETAAIVPKITKDVPAPNVNTGQNTKAPASVAELLSQKRSSMPPESASNAKSGTWKWITTAAIVVAVAAFVFYFSIQATNNHPKEPSASTYQNNNRKYHAKNNRQPKPKKVISKTTFFPSFDCSKAKTASERFICSNAELCKLDVQAANLYREARRKVVDKESFKKEQISWLKNQRDVCSDAESMIQIYKDHIAQLSRY